MSTPIVGTPPLLGRRVLGQLPASVSVPSYRACDLRAGLVHFGVGRFHRAHQAAYLDRLAEQRVSFDWGVVGVGLRTLATHQALARQDRLYSLCESDSTGTTVRVVGHLKRNLFAPQQRAAVLAVLVHPDTKVVSLTITAATYAEPVCHLPDGVFGLVAEALWRRRAAGTAPFTVLSCDNIADNGAAAQRQTLAAADAFGPGLMGWVERHVAFPSTMVDRITPPLSGDMENRINERLGVSDACAVLTEPFSQWVVEDQFCNERPPLEEVGVQLVADAAPYKVIKTRLLNGSHCALGYLGTAAGLKTSSQAMADPLFRGFVEQLMRWEIAPLLPAPLDLDLASYQRSVLTRMSSEAMDDPLSRLSTRGSVRIPSYVLPSLEDALRHGAPHRRLTLVVAGWVAQLRRRSRSLDVADPAAELLQTLARSHGDDLRPLLGHSTVFGTLGEHESWVEDLRSAVAMIEARGVRAAMSAASQPRRRVTAEDSRAAAGRQKAAPDVAS